MKRLLFVMLLFCIFYETLNAADQVQTESVRLRWQAVEYASQYEIIVERQTNANTFIVVADEIKRNGTEIECNLLPGKYRYRVIVYDMFERNTVPSDWLEFEIKQKTVQVQEEKVPEQVEEAPKENPKESADENAGANTDANTDANKSSPFEINVAAGYTPIIALLSGFQPDTTNISFQPVAMEFSLSTLLFYTGIGKFGLELSPSVAILEVDVAPATMSTVLFCVGLNFLYQYSITNTKFINARVGTGLSVFYDFYFEDKEDDTLSYLTNYVTFLFSGALSFQNYFNKTLYIDVGVTYKTLFFSNSVFHFICPFVSVGAKI
ncbi:MAG: hypothetical protein LBV52_02180 [Spirochaetaceae bacterium]|jgi:hypothetical protein|nr:hypothetical protein [Spirochaetaceae bacterium]